MVARNPSHRVGRALVVASSIAGLCLMFAGTASAQKVPDRMTLVTFSGPVEIPGKGAPILPAGTYTFRLLDSTSDRNIVQISSKDGLHVFATVLAIPNHRLKATSKTVITFAERKAGEPQAIRAWFYPGDNWGQQFVYPKTKAVALAAVAQEPVIYMPDEVAPDLPVTAWREVPLKAVDPKGADVAMAEVVLPPPAEAARLPKTASHMPLLALIGVLSLGVGITLRRT